jgi:hypothetical protein
MAVQAMKSNGSVALVASFRGLACAEADGLEEGLAEVVHHVVHVAAARFHDARHRSFAARPSGGTLGAAAGWCTAAALPGVGCRLSAEVDGGGWRCVRPWRSVAKVRWVIVFHLSFTFHLSRVIFPLTFPRWTY